MIALLGLFEHREVLLQLFLRRPRRAVDALEHFVAMVASPVGAGHLHQLEVLELAGGRHMRPAAQVFECAFAVQRNVFTGGNARNDLGLVVLADVLEMRHGLVARQHAALDLLVLLRELAHLGFDRHQVLGREGPLVGEVVVEAVLDHRADRDLRVGKEILHRIGEQMRRRMANDLESGCVLFGDDRERRVAIDAKARVDHLDRVARADAPGDRSLCETGTDRLRHLGHRHRSGVFAFRAIGQLNRDHGNSRNEKARG